VSRTAATKALSTLVPRIAASSAGWLVLIAASVAALVVLVLTGSDEIRAAMIGLIGAAIGSAISTVTSVTTTRETAQAGLAEATWTKRVDAHQAAFLLWRKLLAVVHGEHDARRKAIREAYDWWEHNCLYLSGEARVAFFRLLTNVDLHGIFLLDHKDKRTDETDRAVRKNWKEIMDVGRILIEGAGGHIPDEMLRKLGSPTKVGSSDIPPSLP
jgi:hypothetical protein